MNAQIVCLFAIIAEGRRFCCKMLGLRQLHLDGVDAGFRPAVMACRPATFEAAVQDAVVARRSRGDGDGRLLDRRVAGLAHIRSDIEIRQLAFEGEGDVRADGVAIIKYGDAVDASCFYLSLS
ncbi:hypothetical protein J2046_003760 [Rhizobium petrolearium]|nr:hypothetical protein [Neorhizobium petrolearium]